MAKRGNYSAENRSKVTPAAIRGDGTIAKLSAKYGVPANTVAQWKREALEGMKDSFDEGNGKQRLDHEAEIKRVHAKIGELVGISRSWLKYQHRGEDPLHLTLMRLIDEQRMRTPWYGSRQPIRHLRRQDYCVGRKRVRRLLWLMGPVSAWSRGKRP